MKQSLNDLDYSVLQQCMHCGMCLPACPTYETTRKERNSPRGRISLMRAAADGDLKITDDLADEMNYCLGCLACTSACPAGVDYTTMFETARAETEETVLSHRTNRRILRWLFLDQVFLYPRRLQWIGRLLKLYQTIQLDRLVRGLRLPRLFGKKISDLEKQTPPVSSKFSDQLIDEWERPDGIEIKGKVGMLTGCVQAITFADVNRDTVDVLLHNGWEVFTPRLQPCCGSLHAHNGAPELAEKTSRALMDVFMDEWDNLDAIITNAGGCGSHLKHYTSIFAGSDREEIALDWDQKVKDIHEFLSEKGFKKPEHGSGEKLVLTYHESCHLCHGQGIRTAPREIVRSIPHVEFIELPGSDVCCGSAGIYNVLQPEESARILDRKIQSIAGTGAKCVATSNPGCHLQIKGGLAASGIDAELQQPVTLLAKAYQNE